MDVSSAHCRPRIRTRLILKESPYVGAIAAAIVTAVMENEIADLLDAIQKLNDIINADNEKIRVVGSVQGHVTNMKVVLYLSSPSHTP